jgi:protein-glutamine gamma-glutamyltransferase
MTSAVIIAPFVLGACVLFWGWQAGQLPTALLIAASVEAAGRVDWRVALDEKAFQRIADISSVLFVTLVVIQFNDDLIGGIFQVLKWLPLVLTPLLLAQLYGNVDGVPLSALFASVRRRRSIFDTPAGSIDLRPHFAICCLIAASVGDQHARGFAVVAMALLIALLLGPRLARLRRRRLAVASGLLVAATTVGYLLQTGLYATQSWVEETTLRWMQDPAFSSASPDRSFTAIGTIGRLKFSDRIRLRIDTAAPLTSPLLLHEASYNEYRYASWRNTDAALTAIDPTGDGHTWQLTPDGHGDHRATITVALREDTSVIPLPLAGTTLRSQEILAIQENPFGTILADARAGFIHYEVAYGDVVAGLGDPTPADRFVPQAYEPALGRIVTEMGLSTTDAPEMIAAVERFFAAHFEYSLVQRGRPAFTQALNAFLLENRRGHCEYFATATVLLLRKLGIPARYAVGYAVSEYSQLDQQYVARQRDAHAWVLAFVDGRWRTVDTTPAEWRSQEDATASAFARLFDLSSWIAYQWSQWQISDSRVRAVLPWLLPPLIAWLLWRLRGTRRLSSTPTATPVPRLVAPGLDSEFLAYVQALSEQGHAPRAGETLFGWLRSLPPALAPATTLRPLLELHYRYRFDPAGLTAEERAQLRTMSMQILRPAPNQGISE